MRIGHGYDVHKLVSRDKYLETYPNRKNPELILGGIIIPHDKVLLGHSDADVVLHALMDALLGAAALEDIGHHFSDKDERFAQISSIELLKHVRELLLAKKYSISNIDITVIAEKPKIRPYIPAMKEAITKVLEIENDQLNIKATTTEGLGFIGREEGIAAEAVASLRA